jgi:hypothetical protein
LSEADNGNTARPDLEGLGGLHCQLHLGASGNKDNLESKSERERVRATHRPGNQCSHLVSRAVQNNVCPVLHAVTAGALKVDTGLLPITGLPIRKCNGRGATDLARQGKHTGGVGVLEGKLVGTADLIAVSWAEHEHVGDGTEEGSNQR